jgi:hypothetical protein
MVQARRLDVERYRRGIVTKWFHPGGALDGCSARPLVRLEVDPREY